MDRKSVQFQYMYLYAPSCGRVGMKHSQKKIYIKIVNVSVFAHTRILLHGKSQYTA